MGAIAEENTEVEQLIAAVRSKLESNQEVVGRSIAFGRLTWRQKNGGFEIKIETQI